MLGTTFLNAAGTTSVHFCTRGCRSGKRAVASAPTTQHNTPHHSITASPPPPPHGTAHNIAQPNPTQPNTSQHNIAQHSSTAHSLCHSIAQHGTALHNTTQHSTTPQLSIAQHSTAQHSTSWHRRETQKHFACTMCGRCLTRARWGRGVVGAGGGGQLLAQNEPMGLGYPLFWVTIPTTKQRPQMIVAPLWRGAAERPIVAMVQGQAFIPVSAKCAAVLLIAGPIRPNRP